MFICSVYIGKKSQNYLNDNFFQIHLFQNQINTKNNLYFPKLMELVGGKMVKCKFYCGFENYIRD